MILLQKRTQDMEQSVCTEDRIEHILERCLSDLGLNTPDKQIWNAGLCINNWCLEELVKRDPRNFLILLQKILQKTKEVLEQCQYEMVAPLTLLFSSSLLKAPYVSADCGVLQEAYLLFHSFLSWPEPCCSASKHLLNIIQQELRAPGISFQRLIRSEQGISPEVHCSKTITLLLVSPDEDVPQEVKSVSEQLSRTHNSSRDVTILLILQGFQAVLGPKTLNLQALHDALQKKQGEALQRLWETVTDSMERAASTADLSAARRDLLHSMERLKDGLAVPDNKCKDTGSAETFTLPLPKCHTCSWENNNFDILHHILAIESDLDSPPDCFIQDEEDNNNNNTSVDEEDDSDTTRIEQEFLNNRNSSASSSSRDSGNFLSSSWSAFSTPSCSSGVESDFSEDTPQDDTEERQDNRPRLRKKPKKKSRSILGVERFSSLFRAPRSPSICRRAQSMGFHGDFTKDLQRNGSQLKHSRSLSRKVHPLQMSAVPSDELSPQKHVCMRRRPILSCDEGDVDEVPTLVKVVVFGGDKDAGRLARAYSDLQQRESKCPRLTKTCKLQFYFVPTKRRTIGRTGGHSTGEGQTECNGSTQEDSTTDIAQLLGRIDPWYERNVLNLLSLSSEVLCQTACKEADESVNCTERLPLLADLVLYYCRHAEQQVLVQLYQAELTLVGGERRREVFIHSLELGHTAGTRAVKAMGSASKRFGIDGDREAVPLTLKVGYNKVAVSGRSQWTQTEMVCTSLNLHKACRKPEQLDSRLESLQLTMTEVLKRQSSKSKKGYNQHISISEVKVDKVQVSCVENGTTFAVCLDQDEKKFIQSVTRCEVSLCCKPGSGSDWRSYKPSPGQVQPLHPSYCSLLCLPITSFSSSYP
ncbi:phosphoinositide 3-kinase regulatory subunit 5-like isoform X1 [Xyrichtys novacula]|uniref:Phosphoinositide 3-kinase regulatory subunit 5 n=1 Tax=Xyrichtys novacula TaxID=13765 RepID=A0AAV1GSD6_XYRNO|nr:phosphoinositide 3-kinase regulatory subunit 5-like isoform X1 [Xyrichtys novacula]